MELQAFSGYLGHTGLYNTQQYNTRLLSIFRMDIRKLFGLNLRRLRFAASLSQEALGARMGVDRANIGAMERGVMNVTLLTLWQACQALGCDPGDFFDVEGAGIASTLPPKAKVPRRRRTKL